MEEEHKKRMIQCYGYSKEDKSLKRWNEIRSISHILKNYIIMSLCKVMPDLQIKSRLYRKTGMKVGKNVRFFGASIDIFFPELIEIGDNSIIGFLTTVLSHEFLMDEWRKGPVKIGKNVTIGGMSLILPGVEIGDGATVAAYSLVNKSVEPGDTVGGVPIKRIKRPKRKKL
jgi:acetyltransferase-like isoleucine patch superfamily enzyme